MARGAWPRSNHPDADLFARRVALTSRARLRAAQAAVLQGLLHRTHRAPAGQDLYARTLGRLAEGLHDVVPKEVREQDQQLRARGQDRRFLLMRRITTADVVRDGDVVTFEQFGNIA